MKNALIAVLVLGLGGLALVWRSQTNVLREQEKKIQQLNEKLESESEIAALELQDKCAKQAHEAFRLNGWENEKMAGFSNHYSQTPKKCFVEIESMQHERSTIFTTKTLLDAFEGKIYAAYGWHTDQKKKYWEVPPYE